MISEDRSSSSSFLPGRHCAIHVGLCPSFFWWEPVLHNRRMLVRNPWFLCSLNSSMKYFCIYSTWLRLLSLYILNSLLSNEVLHFCHLFNKKELLFHCHGLYPVFVCWQLLVRLLFQKSCSPLIKLAGNLPCSKIKYEDSLCSVRKHAAPSCPCNQVINN